MGFREAQEGIDVENLGDRIGYGRVMQLCEQIWNSKTPGAAHSVGPCVGLLVPCPHPEKEAGNCDWCCGSGRITERVLKAQNATTALRLLAIMPKQKPGVQHRVEYDGFRCRCCGGTWLTAKPETHIGGCPLEGTS